MNYATALLTKNQNRKLVDLKYNLKEIKMIKFYKHMEKIVKNSKTTWGKIP